MHTPRIGTEIPGPSEAFTIIDFLGNGAFGEVYRAAGKASGKIVAVKLLPIGSLEDESSKAALLNEIKTALQIVHPNVVQVLDFSDQNLDLGPYLVMEYVSGGNLARLIKTQRAAATLIPLPRVREMMIDIAQGSRAINQKLIHRDIKPDNVLIEGTALKIGDFGISKFVDESTRSKTFKGGQHVAYMAPEGWEGITNTVKIDTYSVGILFYQITSLVHPFEKTTGNSNDWRIWEKAHLFEPCPDVRTVRSEVDIATAQLIQRMAAKRPQERPDWDEVLRVLTTPQPTVIAAANQPITAAVEAALKKRQEQEKAALE
ncbi:MAG: serine/threonine protein kinase, partial [Acidobacteriia bacterium]|nr:serine/threonine protein kinase [Terriglobia bacterium]